MQKMAEPLSTALTEWPAGPAQARSCIDIAYLAPLVHLQAGNDGPEQLVREITDGMYDVTTLMQQIEAWHAEGFSLMRHGDMEGKFHAKNYKSALTFKAEVHKSLLKRLQAGKTVGPFPWNGDLGGIPYNNCAVNPLGAVGYKDDKTRARACDDVFCNADNTAPYFKQTALQQIREQTFPYCSYSKTDVEAAFTCMHMAEQDIPWLLFAWYDAADTNFKGTDQDCLYAHTHGNFGPRPMPWEFTCLMLAVNVAAASLNLDIPAAFIDDNIHVTTDKILDKQLPQYWSHLERAGLKDKPSKRERFQCGDILGRWFDSTPPMTLSVPQDKMVALVGMMGEVLAQPRLTLKEVQSFAGFWEFCAEVLPRYLKGFLSSTHDFTKHFGGKHKQTYLWAPKQMRRDVGIMQGILRHAANTTLVHPKAGRATAPPVYGDARGGRHAAAAYVTPHGFKWWKCTGKLKKAHINLLEMQAVLEYYQDNAAYVEGRIVPYYGDNTTVIRCLRRGRSKSRKLNDMCQEILLICYEHDIWPEWHWVASKENILADAASRQQWQIFWENWGAYPGFAGYRRARNLQDEAKEEGSRLKVLHPRARQAVRDTKKIAFEPSTVQNAKSAWVLWEQYMSDNGGSPYLSTGDPNYDIYMAGYEACLAQGIYGKLKSADSILTYKAQVQWSLNQHGESRIKQDVERGMKKQLKLNKKAVDPWKLEYFATLFERHAETDNLTQLQTLLALSMLGFGIQRSRSAVTKSISCWEQKTHLTVSDVKLDRKLYAVWWGIKHSKGDPFGNRLGKDGKDWLPTAGSPSESHPIDIVPLFRRYCRLMNFRVKPDGTVVSPAGDVPFFQQLTSGRPNGLPLTYAQLLAATKTAQRELSGDYPELVDARIGLHSFRRFGATLAKLRGVPDDLIQVMGRWVSLTFQRYFVYDEADLVDINKRLLH